MDSKSFYKVISKVYDLLDVIYFRNIERSPRKAVNDFIEASDVKILDICTGTAANSIYIATHKQRSKIIGIDISKEMSSIANTKIKNKAVKNIELYKMDATKTRFKDNTFDVVLISLVLHEITEELAEKILLEVKRIVKPEGKILVVEWEAPQSTLQKLLFTPLRILEPKGFNHFLEMDMKHYFEKFGLMIKEMKHCDYTKVLYLKKKC